MSRIDNLSLVASVLGFLLAVYGIFTQPVVMESARPTQTLAGEPTNSEVPAYDRLWDDPFAVYGDVYNPLPKYPRLPTEVQSTLFLVIPSKTLAYEEEKENRLRIRYAVQRALFDHGYVAQSGNLISAIKLAPADVRLNAGHIAPALVCSNGGEVPPTCGAADKKKITAPLQIFSRASLPSDQLINSEKSDFSAVVVVWLPDSYIWTADQPESTPGTLWYALREIQRQFAGSEKNENRWILLGPSDSDALAFFEQHWNGATSLPMSLLIVPYSATIAQPLLDQIVKRDTAFPLLPAVKPSIQWSGLLTVDNQLPSLAAKSVGLPLARMPNGDDILCLELVHAIQSHRVFLLPSTPLRVLVLAEWDTLYGRSLAETFTALAHRGDSTVASEPETYRKLRESLKSQLGAEELLSKLQSGPRVEVRVLPYLRGLDGASTLYRKAYRQSIGEDSGKKSAKASDSSTQPANASVEAAEGTTQFDYIRRLVETNYKQDAPFIQRTNRLDAVVIFGTDVYDKLALLEFLRQELRNPLYLTTDLDALYWHPHFLKFTKNLIVASAFPLRMDSAETGEKEMGEREPESEGIEPVAFRDVSQSAVYLAVSRCLHSRQIGSATFPPNRGPRLFRVGNSLPLPVRFAGETVSQGSTTRSASWWLEEVMAVLAQGTSICYSLAFQVGVILLGLWAVLRDIPTRTSLGEALSDEVWSSATIGLNDPDHQRIQKLKSSLKRKWIGLTSWRPFRRSQPPKPFLRPVTAWQNNRTIGDDLNGQLAEFEREVEKSSCKAELASCALRLLATLFCLQAAGTQAKLKPAEYLRPSRLRGFFGRLCALLTIRLAKFGPTRSAWKLCKKSFGPPLQRRSGQERIFLGLEMTPFAKFVARNLALRPGIVPLYPKLRWYWRLVLQPARWIDRRLPTWQFVVSGAGILILMIVICANPAAYLLGPETLSAFWRTARWLLETVALLVICAVFHRVCYEHYRFCELTKELSPLIKERVALSNRQLVILLAQASTPVANLALTPGALLFLIYLSHLPVFGGAPLTFEMLSLLLFPLGVLAYSYARVRGVAFGAAELVKSAYYQEASDAARFAVRLQSYVKGNMPLQDDEPSLELELQSLIEKSSTSNASIRLRPGDLRRAKIRKRCIDYLNALGQRNRAIVEAISGIRDGIFAPLIANPFVAALIIPLGGAGGLNLIQWLVSVLR
jgi:hypothetical protein